MNPTSAGAAGGSGRGAPTGDSVPVRGSMRLAGVTGPGASTKLMPSGCPGQPGIELRFKLPSAPAPHAVPGPDPTPIVNPLSNPNWIGPPLPAFWSGTPPSRTWNPLRQAPAASWLTSIWMPGFVKEPTSFGSPLSTRYRPVPSHRVSPSFVTIRITPAAELPYSAVPPPV